ncbi:unnamed protein product [Clonostachys chloroleuca]|uniref:F-box domain-containing protein n=1 Tax=Clonostachys chloroleuca TaxID=1926264 RepID=A0AA35M7S9_9HYPO|nr:unnamed protein product [Clonostachys chloroleuca]
MAQLSSLPNEIIDSLLELIPRSDLLVLCRVSRSLRHPAERFLYAAISLDWDYHKVPPIVPLLRTLLQRPELFAYVESVSLVGDEFSDGTLPTPLNTTIIPLDQLQVAIERTQVPYINLWVDQLKSGSGSMDALVGLLIANLSKIRFLAITHNFINGFQIVSQVLRSKILGQIPDYSAVFGRLPKFEQLNQVIYSKLRSSAENDNISTDVLSLFYLPTAKDLVVNIPNPGITFKWPAGELNFSHLTSLEVDWVYPRCLAKILLHTPNLKSLYWNWQYRTDATEGSDSFLDYGHIMKALLPLKITLEKLYFRLDEDSLENVAEDFAMVGSWDGLRDFKRLVHLDMPLVSLAGVDYTPESIDQHLPDTLETLYLTPSILAEEDVVLWVSYPEGVPEEDDDESDMEDDWYPEQYIFKVIKALAEKCPQRLPRLYRIGLLGKGGGWTTRMVPLMSEASLEYDIEFQVIHEPHWHRRHLPDYVWDN